MPTAQITTILRRPSIKIGATERAGLIVTAGKKAPALYQGSEYIDKLPAQKWITQELKDLGLVDGQMSDAEAAKHKALSLQILGELKDFHISSALSKIGPEARAGGAKKDEFKEPPANEPVLIRRSTVPPEALFLEEAVDKVPWVNACLNLKALNMASVPVQVMRRQTDAQAEPDTTSEPARRLLRLLERPNAHMSGTDLVEAISFWMNTREALVWMMWDEKRQSTKPADAKGKLPDALYVLPAHRCLKMLYGGSLAYYRITGSDGLAIPAWQVMRIGFYNPKEEFRSLSPLSAAFLCADTDYAIDLNSSNIFENGARFSGLVSLKGQVSEEKRINYEDKFRQMSGVGNAHVTMILDSDATYTSLTTTPRDMDYKNLAGMNKDKLSTSFGVARFMLGDPERSNKASAEVGRRSFWQDHLVPELRKIFDKLNVHLVPYANDPDVYFEPDFSKIEALSDDRTDFATAFMNTATALQTLSGIQAVNQDDIASVLEEKFGLTVEGEKSDDPYEGEEEIMAESVAVQVARRIKNSVLVRMKDANVEDADIVDRIGTLRIAKKFGATRQQAEAIYNGIATQIAPCGRDTEKAARVFSAIEMAVGGQSSKAARKKAA